MALATIGLAALAAPILIGMLKAAAIRAQNAPATKPKFEVASIKPTGSRGGGSMRPWPGRLSASAPLQVLMKAAYHVQDFQIVGGPEWVKSGWLRGRCQGVRQSGARADDAHAAIAARGPVPVAGPSRVAGNAGLCAGAGPRRAQTTASAGWKLCGGATAASPGRRRIPHAAPRCGGMDVLPEAGGWHMRGGKVPMAEFVRKLSELLGRTVTDQTGFFRGIRHRSGIPARTTRRTSTRERVGSPAARSGPRRECEPIDLQRDPATGAAARIDQRAS